MSQYTPSDGRVEWCVSLDPTTWTFALCKFHNEELCIKYLPTSILCKFLKRVKCCKNMIKKSNEEYLNCYYCKKWFDGFCAKHPLIFIREQIPSVVPYTAKMTVPPFLNVRYSFIGGGQGVFALFDLPRGLTFGPYGGKLSYTIWAQKSGYSWQVSFAKEETSEKYFELRVPIYGFTLKKSSRSHQEAPVIDGYDQTYSNWMRYVNCARNEEEQNLVALFYKQQIYYTTCKPIRKHDDELLIWYGSAYGKLLSIENAESASGPTAPKKVKRSDYDWSFN